MRLEKRRTRRSDATGVRTTETSAADCLGRIVFFRFRPLSLHSLPKGRETALVIQGFGDPGPPGWHNWPSRFVNCTTAIAARPRAVPAACPSSTPRSAAGSLWRPSTSWWRQRKASRLGRWHYGRRPAPPAVTSGSSISIVTRSFIRPASCSSACRWGGCWSFACRGRRMRCGFASNRCGAGLSPRWCYPCGPSMLMRPDGSNWPPRLAEAWGC